MIELEHRSLLCSITRCQRFYRQLLINAQTVQVGTGTDFSGNPGGFKGSIWTVHEEALWPAHCSTPRYPLHGPTASRYWWAITLEIWCK